MAKKIRYTNEKNAMRLAKKFANAGQAFYMHVTTSTAILETQTAKFLIGNRLKPSTLGFIQQVKDAAKACGKPRENVSPADISYYRFGRIPTGKIKNVVEIDLNKAYWNKARELGYISEKAYQKGLQAPKLDRLMAFGALATNRHTYRYEPQTGEFELECKKVDPVTRSYFFKVAYEIDLAMREVFSVGGVYFYWVDAFFCQASRAGAINKKLDSLGLDYSEEALDSISVKETDFGTYRITCNLQGGDKKTFWHSTVNKGVRAVRSVERVLSA